MFRYHIPRYPSEMAEGLHFKIRAALKSLSGVLLMASVKQLALSGLTTDMARLSYVGIPVFPTCGFGDIMNSGYNAYTA